MKLERAVFKKDKTNFNEGFEFAHRQRHPVVYECLNKCTLPPKIQTIKGIESFGGTESFGGIFEGISSQKNREGNFLQKNQEDKF